jgi:hypothetical protein
LTELPRETRKEMHTLTLDQVAAKLGSWPLFVQVHRSKIDGELVHAQRAENVP